MYREVVGFSYSIWGHCSIHHHDREPSHTDTDGAVIKQCSDQSDAQIAAESKTQSSLIFRYEIREVRVVRLTCTRLGLRISRGAPRPVEAFREGYGRGISRDRER